MPISTLAKDTLSSFIKEEDNVTRSNLEANPLTVLLAVPFADFIENNWKPTFLKEQTLNYGLALGNAQVAYADVVLNGLVKKLDSALLMLTGKDRTAPLYLLYFGAQRPFEVAAGILGPQLETMRGWIPLLAASPEATLQAIGEEIKTAVAAADAAVKVKVAAESALLVFETTGEGALLVQSYNALRKVTYGELGKIKHQHPELPNEFADTFFRHEGKRAEDKLSADQLQTKIEVLKVQQAGLEKRRQALLDKHQEEADAKLLLDEKQAVIEAKKKEKEALDAAIKRLEDDLKK
jgi:hypothetical protein